MTSTSAQTTNAVTTSSSEKLAASWLNAYQLKLFRRPEDDIEMLKNDTLNMRDDRLEGYRIFFPSRSVELQRREAVRTFIDRLEAQSSRERDVPSIRVAGMEKWEGRVLEVDDEYFTVELVPFGLGAEVVADFSTDLLSEDDEIQAGDVVYVTVRTVSGVGGPTRTSAVRLRRLGIWTEENVADRSKRAKKRLAELESSFD